MGLAGRWLGTPNSAGPIYSKGLTGQGFGNNVAGSKETAMNNPISSPSTGGAVGDLGLSLEAQKSAQAVADLAKKKKLQQATDIKNAGSGGMPSSLFNTLSTGQL